MRRDGARSLWPALIILLSARALTAQTFHGGVRGAVRDRDGVVPSATVELAQEATGISRRTMSNARGEYVFADVVPERYSLRVTAPGYKIAMRTALQVGTQAFLIVDVTLDVGSLTDVVSVTARAPLAEGASVSTLLDRHALDTQPSAGRNVFFSATTTPTVVPSGDAQFVRQQDQSNSSLISIGGGPRRNNSYVLDGVPIVDVLNRATFIPSFQAVEEMRVQISSYAADIGRTAGGVFNTTTRSGSNQWHGGTTYEDRPGRGQSRLFFAKKTGLETPDSYYHLYGGSLGGPIARNRTFFWASTEGYRSSTSRSTVLVLPTDAERRGDFSRSGVTIYDPLTTRRDPDDPSRFIRDPFPNNQIPADRLNPVALSLLKYLPMPTSGKSRPAAANIVDQADQVTGKITHRLSDRVTLTGLYAWYGSAEPCARFYGQPLFANPADPGEGALVRRTQLVAVNGLWTPTDRVVVHARYGFNRFLDDNRPGTFDPSQLGFDPRFLSTVSLLKFPSIAVADYGRFDSLLGDRNRGTATYYSHQANAGITALRGRHMIKAGGEYRVTGVRFLNIGGTGSYSFNRNFTFGPNPNAPGGGTGDGVASFLLGYPSSASISVSVPIDVFLNYWSGFAQDEIRLSSKLTLSAGLRYEFEQGLQERDNHMAVGWAYQTPFPVQVGGTRPDGTPLALTGGLLYAGQTGAPAHQGDPNRLQFAPRASVTYALDERTAITAGYGLFWAPMQGISADEFGSGTPGYSQTTNYVATGANPFVPCESCSLTNPFPKGFAQPHGNSLGRLTGVGGPIEFVDPRSRMAHVHRYSVDVRRELAHGVAVGAAYVGARGEDLATGLDGAPININQLDPKYFPLGTTLQDPVPNPFFGTSLGVGVLATPTVPRGQLLRPYPHFDAVLMTRASVARSRYDALLVRAERRWSRGWSARADYTRSRQMDSQYGEGNFFAGGSSVLDYYDIDREYGLSVLDAPHRWNVAASVALPLGLTLSAVGMYQSGFPVSVRQSPNNSNLFGSGQRPNLVAGVDPQLRTNPRDSYDAACGCLRWLNPAAWTQAAPFTFGNAPRTDGRMRTPARRNLDLAVDKAVRVGRAMLGLRAEVINVLDAADLRGPNIVFGDASFGQIREAGGFPRMLQLMVRAGW